MATVTLRETVAAFIQNDPFPVRRHPGDIWAVKQARHTMLREKARLEVDQEMYALDALINAERDSLNNAEEH